MRTAYYIEVKHVLVDNKGNIIPILNIGQMPMIYLSYDKALCRAAKMVAAMTIYQGYEYTEDINEIDEDLPKSLYRRKLVITDTFYYAYISIYEITIC